MSAASPEQVAGDLLSAGRQSTPPADVGSVVRLLRGLNAVSEPLDHDGFIVDVPDGAEIIVNARTSAVRQRFTLAHEIGHYALRIGLGDSSELSGSSEVERWCDRFAVGLLMPRSWVKAYMRGASTATLADRIARGPKKFGVSRQAFWLRVSEVGEIWAFELTPGGQLATHVRPDPPTAVLRLASDCVNRAAAKNRAYLTAAGLSASCTRLSASPDREERFLAVVALDTPGRRSRV